MVMSEKEYFFTESRDLTLDIYLEYLNRILRILQLYTEIP